MKKRLILSSIMSIILCFCLATGSAYALFTSESNVNVAVSYGKVDVTAKAENFKTYSASWNEATKSYESVEQSSLTFATLGTVTVNNNDIVINNMAPMDKLTFDIIIENNSSILAKYQTIFTVSEELTDTLVVELENENQSIEMVNLTNSVASKWFTINPSDNKQLDKISVTILLPENVTNMDVTGSISYTVKAIQGNAHVVDPVENNENELYIYSLNDLKAFRDDVNNGNTYNNKTVYLMDNIDLNNEEWEPIGTSNSKFSGVFDGNGFTISNLSVNKENDSYVGLFGYTVKGEVKNLNINNATVKGYLGVAVVSGSPFTAKFTNIKVTGDVKVEGMAYVGGVVGRNSYADLTDIIVDVNEGSYVYSNSVSGGVAYRTYVGGVVGFLGEGAHTLKNISSNIDVIGSTIDVGGIAGIAHYDNTFINCSSSGNVTLQNADTLEEALEIGGIAGVWHNQDGHKVVFENCSYTGVLSSKYVTGEVTTFENNGLVGAKYSATGTGELIIR